MTKSTEQFLALSRRFLESPVLQALNANEWRALIRIMVEHLRHRGFANEGLPVTKGDFVQAGVGHNYVAAATRVLEALGIVKCIRRAQNAGAGRLPNLWCLTFLPTTPQRRDATHDYERFATRGEA